MTLQPPPGVAGAASLEAKARPLRVLIADDDRDAVLMLATLLFEEGCETKAVYRGDEVLKCMRDWNPDAALIDIGMPGTTGYEVAREMRRRYGRQAPLLIAVTAWNKPSDKILARLAGFDHHVGKPYDPNELMALVHRLERPPPMEPQPHAEAEPAAFSRTLHGRLLRKAAEALGGVDALQRRLLVPESDLAKWLVEAEPLPAPIFLRAVDILIEAVTVSRLGEFQPPEDEI